MDFLSNPSRLVVDPHLGAGIMSTNLMHRAVGAFADRDAVEIAIHRLRDADFNMGNVSVAVKNEENTPDKIDGVGVTDTLGDHSKEGAATGATTGVAVGGLAGLLVGIGAVAIPGLGPVMLAGALGTAAATAVAGGAIGAATGGLAGTLIGLGIPEGPAERYSEVVREGGYLVMVDGSEEEIQRAHAILSTTSIQDLAVYSGSSPTFVERARNFDGETIDQNRIP